MAYGDKADTLWRISDAAGRLAEAEAEPPEGVRSIGELLFEEFGGDNGKWRKGGRLNTGSRAIQLEPSFTGALAVAQPALAPAQQRPLVLRDFALVVPTTSTMYPYVRELAPMSTEMAASGVAEGATKPDASQLFNFKLAGGAPVTIGTIAANITVTNQLWDDSPLFVQYVNNRLPYSVALREEYACFQGNGETVNAGITGVLHDSDVVATTAGSDLIATIFAIYGTLVGNGVAPDAVFVNALDWATVLKNLTNAGTYGPMILLALQALQAEIVSTLSVPAGTVIGGDFGQGTVIFDRDSVNVQVYGQHSDYAVKNQSLIQAEERVGFHITAPWRVSYSTGVTP